MASQSRDHAVVLAVAAAAAGACVGYALSARAAPKATCSPVAAAPAAPPAAAKPHAAKNESSTPAVAAAAPAEAALVAAKPHAGLHWAADQERRGLGTALLKVNHIGLIVSDVGRSASFYSDVLGLQQIRRPNFDRHGACAAARDCACKHSPGRVFGRHSSKPPPAPTNGQQVFAAKQRRPSAAARGCAPRRSDATRRAWARARVTRASTTPRGGAREQSVTRARCARR